MWSGFYSRKRSRGERRRKKKKEKNKKKRKRKKNVGPYEYANEGIASPPFSQAQWKENGASKL